MINFKNMYDSIKNPLDDDSIIRGLIETFAKEKNIYSYLTRANILEKKETQGRYYEQVKDDLYSKLFKIWKSNVLSLTDNQVQWLIKHGEVESDYYNLREYLKTLPEIKTYKEFIKLAYNKDNDLIEKYGWQSLGMYSGWTHVSSRRLTTWKQAGLDIEHRLYLNTESLHTEIIASIFIDKCFKRNIPFYFKYDTIGNRDDTLVIYSDTEHLSEYIEILREIKSENAKIFEQIHKPPILTGQIDGWIGYGSEPSALPNGKLTSFNAIRSKTIEKAIQTSRNNWITNHRNDLITYKGESIRFKEYLSYKVTDKVVEKYNTSIDKFVKNGKKKELYDMYGLVSSDFNNKSINHLVKSYVDSYIDRFISSLTNNLTNPLNIDVPTREMKKISIYDSDFYSVFTSVVKEIVRHDPSFVNNVKQEIIKESIKVGIDTDKYCFDNDSRDKLLSYNTKKQPIEIVNNQEINANNICNKINPSLINKKMKYPSGAEASLEKYIKEYFFRFIPSDGFFTLKDGTRLSYKQYIEEVLIDVGQTKYNGNAARLVADTTRNNEGIITIQNDGESINIHPAQITDYLNPELMKRNMKCPNGTTLNAKQYIQEYFSMYIPSNGKVILKNGFEIPVKQYIEGTLMNEGQTKYNGDIALLLQSTTRNNKGNIAFDLNKEKQRQKELKSKLINLYDEMVSNKGIKM